MGRHVPRGVRGGEVTFLLCHLLLYAYHETVFARFFANNDDRRVVFTTNPSPSTSTRACAFVPGDGRARERGPLVPLRGRGRGPRQDRGEDSRLRVLRRRQIAGALSRSLPRFRRRSREASPSSRPPDSTRPPARPPAFPRANASFRSPRPALPPRAWSRSPPPGAPSRRRSRWRRSRSARTAGRCTR